MVGIAACSPQEVVPTGTKIVHGKIGNYFSPEYYCDIGIPGYEGYCDDFGGGVPDDDVPSCVDVVDGNDWYFFNYEDCGGGWATVDPIDITFQENVYTYLEENMDPVDPSWDDICYALRTAAEGLMTTSRVREAVESVDGEYADTHWDTPYGISTAMTLVNPSQFVDVATFAGTLLHEVQHPIFQIGEDDQVYVGTTLNGDQINNNVAGCYPNVWRDPSFANSGS
jgi:hypothetical protein